MHQEGHPLQLHSKLWTTQRNDTVASKPIYDTAEPPPTTAATATATATAATSTATVAISICQHAPTTAATAKSSSYAASNAANASSPSDASPVGLWRTLQSAPSNADEHCTDAAVATAAHADGRWHDGSAAVGWKQHVRLSPRQDDATKPTKPSKLHGLSKWPMDSQRTIRLWCRYKYGAQ